MVTINRSFLLTGYATESLKDPASREHDEREFIRGFVELILILTLIPA